MPIEASLISSLSSCDMLYLAIYSFSSVDWRPDFRWLQFLIEYVIVIEYKKSFASSTTRHRSKGFRTAPQHCHAFPIE